MKIEYNISADKIDDKTVVRYRSLWYPDLFRRTHFSPFIECG